MSILDHTIGLSFTSQRVNRWLKELGYRSSSIRLVDKLRTPNEIAKYFEPRPELSQHLAVLIAVEAGLIPRADSPLFIQQSEVTPT